MSLNQAIASAAFGRRDEVEAVMGRLLAAGIPRDQIEVATDPATAKQAFTRPPRHRAFEVLSEAGRGGLYGLLASIGLSLLLVLAVDIRHSGPLAVVQLLGPNVGTLTGAMLGGLWGLLKPRPLANRYCRVRQTGGILVIVRCPTDAEARQVLQQLTAAGGRAGEVAAAA